MKKKFVLAVGTALAAVLALSGCSGVKNDSAQQGGKVEIRIAEWPQETNAAAYAQKQEQLKIMNERYPDITIVPDEWKYDVNSFLPKAASGDLPTMFVTSFTEPSKIVEAGYVRDISDFVKKYGYDTGTNPDLLEFMQYDGKYYGTVHTAFKLGMAYNLKLFEQAGELDENGLPNFPKTWVEAAELAVRVKEKTGKPGYFIYSTKNQGGWMFMNVAWAYGVKFEQKIDNKWQATFNSPEGVAALQFIKDLRWKYNVLQDNVLAETSEFAKLFATDQVAMGIANFTTSDTMINDYKMSKDNIAFSALPAGPVDRTTVAGGSLNLFDSKATDDQVDACFKWLEVLGESPSADDNIKQYVELNQKTKNEEGKIVGPTAMTIWVSPERVALDKEMNDKYSNVDMNKFADFLDNTDVKLHVEEPLNTQELYKALDSVIQAVLTDENADCQQLLDTAASDFQRDYLDKVS